MPGLVSLGLRHRIEEPFATNLLVNEHVQFAIGRPTPSKGHRENKALLKLPQLAHGSQTVTLLLVHLLSSMEALPFSMHKRCPLLLIMDPEVVLLMNLLTALW